MEKEHYHGHRQRLRERFLENGLESFADYETVEFLLASVILHKYAKEREATFTRFYRNGQ